MNTDPKFNHFLLLGLKMPLLKSDHPKGYIRYPNTFSVKDKITFSVVLTQEKSKENPIVYGMILISSREGLLFREGLHYAHAIETLLPITYFCTSRILTELSILPLTQKTYKVLARPWSASKLVSECNDDITDLFGDPVEFQRAFLSYMVSDIDWFTSIVPYTRRYIMKAEFRRGCSYLFLSMWELGVDVCDWAQEDYDQSFYRFVSVSKAESAVLNAFKAIETIIGEPSKNRTTSKLTQKLLEYGIDANEPVGYKTKGSLIEKLIDFHRIRDSIAAHGIGKFKRDLKLSEIIELQSLAQYLLLNSTATQIQKQTQFVKEQ